MRRDVVIRPATDADADAIRVVHDRCVGDAFAGLLGDWRPSPQDRKERERSWVGASYGCPAPRHAALVAERNGRVVGFVAIGPTRDDEDRERIAELRTVMVDPAERGTGTGAALVAAGEDAMRDGGFALATLWVVASNTPAVRCYERAGWHPEGAQRVLELAGRKISTVRYSKDLR